MTRAPAISEPARQRTPEWYAARRNAIGSSDAPVIAGVSPWGDIRTLFADKLGWTAPTTELPRMTWGLKLEEVIAAAYTERTGRKVRRARRLRRHPDIPWMIASLDRVAVGERRIVEIKTARYASEAWGPDESDEIPDHVRVQVLHQMEVTGYDVADVVALFSGSDLRRYTIERDQGLIDDLVRIEGTFWRALEDHRLPDELLDRPPQALPLREGEVTATDRIEVLAGLVYAQRAMYDKAKEEKEAAEDRLREELGDLTAVRGETLPDPVPPAGRAQGDRLAGGRRRLPAPRGASRSSADRTWPSGAYWAVHAAVDLDAIEELFTVTKPGIRPLRLTISKEKHDDASL